MPQVGRNFTKDDDGAGSQHVVILGESLWHRRYNDDREIVGKSIRIDGQPYTVVGVLPRGFQFLATRPASSAIEIWTPLQLPATSHDPRSILECIGRLNAGVTRQQGAAEITALSRRLAIELPPFSPQREQLLCLHCNTGSLRMYGLFSCFSSVQFDSSCSSSAPMSPTSCLRGWATGPERSVCAPLWARTGSASFASFSLRTSC